MRSAPSIAFDYRPAATLVALAGAIVVLALAAPWLSALPGYGKAAVSLTAAAYGIVTLRRSAGQARAALQRVARGAKDCGPNHGGAYCRLCKYMQ